MKGHEGSCWGADLHDGSCWAELGFPCTCVCTCEDGDPKPSLCPCGHTKDSHAPGECVGCTGPDCNDGPVVTGGKPVKEWLDEQRGEA